MAASAVLRFSDPQEYEQAIRAADIELFPTTKGTFQAELTQLTLGGLWAQSAQESLPRIYTGAVRPGRAVIGFLSDADQPTVQHCGMDVPPGVIIVNDSRWMHRRTEAAGRWSSMSLTHEDMAVASKCLIGCELPPPSFTHLIRPDPAVMTEMLSLHCAVVMLAKVAPDVLENSQVTRALEQQLTRMMVRCLAEGSTLSVSPSERHHSAIMATFEQFLAQRQLEPVYLAEMCAATGVSERTLRICCHEHLGMGPVRYLWLRRMHLARRALKQVMPESTTVTRIATDHGFWELGRFAMEYKALFGERPSETLRRLPD